jgi:tRNA pseudouridine55 synthase
MTEVIDGVLPVYKEAGMTSQLVTSIIKRLSGKKAGHAGTLDPIATGVLPICIGSATKLYESLISAGKSYECVCILGKTTDTLDYTGKILEEKPVLCSEEKITDVFRSFLGGYMQNVPAFSAAKQNGRRLYDIARNGGTIIQKTKFAEISQIELLEINMPDKVRFSVECGKGVYIRAICADAGEKLECGAFMASLERTRSGIFTADKSFKLSEIKEAQAAGKLNQLIIKM